MHPGAVTLIAASCLAAAGCEDGSSASGGGAGGSAAADGGSGASGGGTSGAGGTAGGASGAGGTASVSCQTYAGEEICTAPCATLPQTLALGSTIAVDTTAADLCWSESPAQCWFTNNSYDDGPDACSLQTRLLSFLLDASQTPARRRATARYGATFSAASAGTIGWSGDIRYLIDVPDATSVTVTFGDGASSWQVAFRFDGATVTVTSVTKL